MNRRENGRRWGVIGALVFSAGVIIFGVAFAMSGFNIQKISTRPPYEEKTYILDYEGQSLVVEDKNLPIELGVSPDDKIHMTCYESEKEWYETKTSGTEIRIGKADSYTWMDYFMVMDLQQKNLTLLLPKAFQGDIELQNSNGRITVEDLSFKDAEFITSNDEIRMENVKTGNLKAHTDNGSVRLENVTGGSISAKSSNGPLRFTDVSGADMTAQTDNGVVELVNVAGTGMTAITSNGRIIAKQLKVSGEARLETGNDKIAVEELDAGEAIVLKSSNGNISGTVAGSIGDFNIRSNTSNGDNSLPKESKSGDKLLDVRTDNGNIQLEFTE